MPVWSDIHHDKTTVSNKVNELTKLTKSLEKHEERESYLAGGKPKKQACNGGAKKLSDPVNDTTQEGNVTTDEGTEGNGRVDVAAGDVGTDGDGDKKSECMGESCGNEAGRGAGAVIGELVEGYA